MFTIRCNGWLLSAALLLAMAGHAIAVANDASSSADAVRQFLNQDGSAPAPSADVQVAQADAGTPPVTTGSYQEPAPGQNIQMELAEPEKDVLTREAIDKLNAEIGSLTFKDTDLADVIRFIGRKLDLNFIFDSDVVKGRITLTFRNVRVRDALNSILTAQKLALVPDKSGIFRIVPQDRVGGREVETRTDVVQLNWVSAVDVQKTMKPFLSKEGRMETNEESNVIIITDVPPNLDNIKDLIHRVDLPERQVMIEARLVDINIEGLRNLGTRWTLAAPRIANVAALGTPADVLGIVNILNQGLGINSGSNGQSTLALGGTVGMLGRDYDLNMAFSVLENRNIVQILANPRVSTLNNVPANIKIVQQIPYISAAQVSNGTQTEQVEFKESGVEITIKPIITPNGFVRMEIQIAQKIFRGRVGSAALDPPLIDERNADTNVIVPSGETAILGGLRQLQNNEGIVGVPWVHRIPLLGWLFKDKNYNQTKTELVLMMTPNIIEKPKPLVGREADLYGKIDRDWHIPDRFMDDVSNADDKSDARME